MKLTVSNAAQGPERDLHPVYIVSESCRSSWRMLWTLGNCLRRSSLLQLRRAHSPGGVSYWWFLMWPKVRRRLYISLHYFGVLLQLLEDALDAETPCIKVIIAVALRKMPSGLNMKLMVSNAAQSPEGGPNHSKSSQSPDTALRRCFGH